MRSPNTSNRTIHARTDRRQVVSAAVGLGLAAGMGSPVSAQSGQMPEHVQAIDPKSADYPLVDEKATLRILMPSDSSVVDYATNEFTKWYEERTNVHIEWDVVPGGDEADIALNVRLAGGDYPDIIMGFGMSPTLQQIYGSLGIFQPLNEQIDAHGIETRRIFEDLPLVRPSITALDGNIYALPIVSGCHHCEYSQKLWIYKPWLDDLGLEMPTTTEEFEQVLLAFKNGDPNGNGEADELPLVGATGGAYPLDFYFMNAFIYNPGYDSLGTRLTVRDGTVEAIYAQPEWREGSNYLARLFSQGLIDPESFTQDLDQLRSKFQGDPLVGGSVPILAPSIFLPVTEGEYGRWTDYVCVPPLEGPAGVRLAAYDPYQALRQGMLVITDKCDNPELAFRWADGLYDLEASFRSTIGVLGEQWRWAKPGEIGNNGEPAVAKKLESVGGVANYDWGHNNPYSRPEGVHSAYVMDPEIADRSLETILYRETEEKYEPYAQPAEWTLPPLFFGEDEAAEVATIGSALELFVEETFALAVTGQIDFDAEWDGYLEDLEGLGLSKFVQLHQEAYNAWSDTN